MGEKGALLCCIRIYENRNTFPDYGVTIVWYQVKLCIIVLWFDLCIKLHVDAWKRD